MIIPSSTSMNTTPSIASSANQNSVREASRRRLSLREAMMLHTA